MCFEVHPRHPIAKIAKKDIVCYKVVRDDMCPLHFNHCGFGPYVIDSINPSITLRVVVINFSVYISVWDYHTEIEQGYHSYSDIRAATRVSKFCYRPIMVKLVSCIIPKGEVYYFNPDKHEYVSTNIIIKEVIK